MGSARAALVATSSATAMPRPVRRWCCKLAPFVERSFAIEDCQTRRYIPTAGPPGFRPRPDLPASGCRGFRREIHAPGQAARALQAQLAALGIRRPVKVDRPADHGVAGDEAAVPAPAVLGVVPVVAQHEVRALRYLP